MLNAQKSWSQEQGWQDRSTVNSFEPSLVLAFGNRHKLSDSDRFDEIKQFYPNANIITCSTAGEIVGTHVQNESIVLNAMQFSATDVHIEQLNYQNFDNSSDLGEEISRRLNKPRLKHIMVFSDGQFINGSELVKGMNKHLPKDVAVTGGLAGDDARFEQTLVGFNQTPSSGNVVGIGFYSDHLKIGYGSVGGWDSFGPKRKVTKSSSNVLYELDGKSALELYKRYLGDKAEELPGSALLFPLSVQLENDSKPLVRTILSVNEEDQSMTFAGDLPEGTMVQFMKANFDKLIDAAYDAAEEGKQSIVQSNPELAILISCVGRKLVLDQMIEEEVESTAEVLGKGTPQIGFYSYGEISPFAGDVNCELHNQTMTITIFSEK